ncbi:MAG TPA: DUF4394 domain-containing protein [Solirubrobacteraceae bacterium]|jgi:hypothetical protein
MLRTALALAGSAIALALTAAPAAADPADALIYATTGDTLLSFREGPPVTQVDEDPFVGLGTAKIVALDFRPAGGELYGLRRESGGTFLGLVKIDPITAQLSPVGDAFTGGWAFFNVEELGFDFSPVADRARAGFGDDLNLRFHPQTGVVTNDGPLQYPAGDPNDPADPAPLGLAYDDNVHGAVSTTLYGYDTAPNPDVFFTLANPNNGVMTTLGSNGTINAEALGGFDVQAGTGAAFVVLKQAAAPNWDVYDVNLSTPSTSNGRLVSPDPVYGIAIAPDSLLRFTGTEAGDESSGIQVHVARSGDTDSATAVKWVVTGGTASGADLSASSGTVAFAEGQAAASFVLPTVDDAGQEGEETVKLELREPENGAFAGIPFQRTVTIPANDAPPADGDGDPPPAPPGDGPPLPPPPPPGPGADTTAPFLTLSAQRQRARRARRSGVRFSLTTDEAVQLVAELRVRGRRIGRLRRSVAAGTNALVVRAARRQRRKLKAGRVVAIVLTATDAAGNVTTKTLGVRLRPSRPR